jgi:NAD(P)-dependent dehydrogenase (short-subunit alcohol dehydrogenase family)
MKKINALVIGGTSSIGLRVSEELIARNSAIITISRSLIGIPNIPHYQCDVMDKVRLKSILKRIGNENYCIDSLWCVAGYAYPKKIEEQTQEIFERHRARNLEYVIVAAEILGKKLAQSEHPILITIGSQWSYRPEEDCREMAPYARAKHELRQWTIEFASSHPRIIANHYCIPTTNTNAYHRIEQTFAATLSQQPVKSQQILANPQLIAKSLVHHALTYNCSGKTLRIKSDGEVEVIS